MAFTSYINIANDSNNSFQFFLFLLKKPYIIIDGTLSTFSSENVFIITRSYSRSSIYFRNLLYKPRKLIIPFPCNYSISLANIFCIWQKRLFLTSNEYLCEFGRNRNNFWVIKNYYYTCLVLKISRNVFGLWSAKILCTWSNNILFEIWNRKPIELFHWFNLKCRKILSILVTQ